MTFRLQIRTWGWSRTFWSLLWPSRGRRGLLSDWYRDKHTSWPGRYRHNVQIGYLYNHTYWLGTYQIILRIYFVAQIFIGSSTMNVSIYLENIRVIYFSLPTTIKHGWQKITLHWINSIIRNNKCIFTKLNAVFILKTAVWTTKILQQIISSQIPDRFSKLLCSTAVP